MRQVVVVKVHLTFESEYALDDDHTESILLGNIERALASWAESSETGLCPEEMEGYTDEIVVFLNQVYKPEV